MIYPIYLRGVLRRFPMVEHHYDLDVFNTHACFICELTACLLLAHYRS